MGLEDKLRIDVEAGYDMAASFDRTPRLQGLVYARPKKALGRADTSVIERFRNLVRVFRKVYRIRDNESQLEGYKTHISKSHKFPSMDFDLCNQAFEIIAERQDFDAFVSRLEPTEFRNLFTDDNIESSIQRFNERSDLNFCKLADKFVYKLMNWIDERKSPGSEMFSAKLVNLRRELTREKYLLDPRGISDDDREHCKHMDPVLEFKLNYSAQHVMVNQVNCCITGPRGKHRDASILYWLDPNVFAWMFHPVRNPRVSAFDPFGMAIFVKAKGLHYAKSGEPEDYLVFEGFPANREHYWRLKNSGFSLPYLVYKCGIWLAHELEISKMLINTGHGNNTQQSVVDTVYAMIKIAKNDDVFWKFKEPSIKELLADIPSASLEAGNQQFLYTHFLQKPSLDSNLVEKLRKRDDWSGESVFDTLNDWNKFIMKTHPKWSDEMKAKHPYAEAVFERGKDPQWNLGIGYCKGFEVDVEKEYDSMIFSHKLLHSKDYIMF